MTRMENENAQRQLAMMFLLRTTGGKRMPALSPARMLLVSMLETKGLVKVDDERFVFISEDGDKLLDSVLEHFAKMRDLK